MPDQPKPRYAALRLHGRNAAAWAVISLATGAIATGAGDRLLMRLTEDEASRIAAQLSDASSEDKAEK